MCSNISYIHLHTHSQFSLLAGTARIEQLVARARELGMPALALTDTNRMSGWILFYQACKEAGIQPILGVELDDPDDPDRKMVVLAKSRRGYAEVCRLTTMRQLEFSEKEVRLDRDFFSECFASPIPEVVMFTHHPELLEQLAQTPNRPNLFGELLNHNSITRARSRRIEKSADRLGLGLVVTNDIFLLHRRDWQLHRYTKFVYLLF